MSWELFKRSFPEGIEVENYGFQTAESLEQQPEIAGVIVKDFETARHMIIRNNSYIFGKNNEYAHGIDYDIYSGMEHPDQRFLPLSVYGMKMVKDFMVYNDISEE